ncbi:MAG TPA: alpha/beta fold hydrolase [Dehalococcoidia bacterium]
MSTLSYFTRDGLSLAYRTAGEGFPIVFVHGFTGNMRNWALTAPVVARSYRAISVDLRGHGESQASDRPEAYTPDVLAEDVYHLLQLLGVDACVLVGHSMGGRVAQEFALAHGELLRGLVLVDTSAGGRARSVQNVSLEEVEAMIREGGMEAVFDRVVSRGFLATPETRANPEAREAWRRQFLKTSPYAYLYCSRAMAESRVLLDLLPQIRVPALVICGERDEPFVQPSRELHERLPDSRLVYIPGAGHSPQIERPEAFNAALLDFLAAVVPGGAP